VALFVLALAIMPGVEANNADDSEFLWLVNRDSALPSSHVPKNLVSYNGFFLQEAALSAYKQMTNAMSEDGINGLRLQSAYRAYSYQESIFQRRVREYAAKGHSLRDATALAATSIHPPGSSEHQLGLALDVSIDGMLTQAFGETDAGKWLAENCHNYGFIIRYPREKTDITQIVYEPWHLRYVGVPHSKIMKNIGLTLEEYLIYIADAGMYISWEEEMYYLLVYSDTFPTENLADVIDVSSLGADRDRYIITIQRKGYCR